MSSCHHGERVPPTRSQFCLGAAGTVGHLREQHNRRCPGLSTYPTRPYTTERQPSHFGGGQSDNNTAQSIKISAKMATTRFTTAGVVQRSTCSSLEDAVHDLSKSSSAWGPEESPSSSALEATAARRHSADAEIVAPRILTPSPRLIAIPWGMPQEGSGDTRGQHTFVFTGFRTIPYAGPSAVTAWRNCWAAVDCPSTVPSSRNQACRKFESLACSDWMSGWIVTAKRWGPSGSPWCPQVKLQPSNPPHTCGENGLYTFVCTPR